jgi:hypothetical protein
MFSSLTAKVFRDRTATRENRDVLEHGLATITKARRLDGRDLERHAARVLSHGFAVEFRAGHPSWRRCSSLKYVEYSHSSRLARRAPRPEFFRESMTQHTG